MGYRIRIPKHKFAISLEKKTSWEWWVFSSLESRGPFLDSMSLFGFLYLTLGSWWLFFLYGPHELRVVFFCWWFLLRIGILPWDENRHWVRTTSLLRESMSLRKRFSKHEMTSKSSKFLRFFQFFLEDIPWNFMVLKMVSCSLKKLFPDFLGEVLIFCGGKFCGHLP